MFEGASGASKGFGALRRGIGGFAGVREERGQRVESDASGGGRGSPDNKGQLCFHNVTYATSGGTDTLNSVSVLVIFL